jgi:hypothetical protein
MNASHQPIHGNKRKSKNEPFKYTEAFYSVFWVIVCEFLRVWLDLATGTLLIIIAGGILLIIVTRLFWHFLTR